MERVRRGEGKLWGSGGGNDIGRQWVICRSGRAWEQGEEAQS